MSTRLRGEMYDSHSICNVGSKMPLPPQLALNTKDEKIISWKGGRFSFHSSLISYNVRFLLTCGDSEENQSKDSLFDKYLLLDKAGFFN